jgi:type I restriction enzyme S subunit
MSKLDELIAELCPDGVEYIPLGEVLKNNNAPNSISKKYYKDNGDIPIIDQSQVYIAGYTDDESAVPPILPCIIFGDHTRVVKYADRKFAQGDSGTKVFIPVTEDLNTKYIYYAFCNIDIPSRGYNRHWTIAKNIKIPLPPLPVQQEIVRILDNFTELTAELTARRKQYEYYRDLLLTFGDEVEWKTLGEVCEKIASGKNKSRNDSGEFPVYGSTGIIAYSDSYAYNEELLLVARVGANAGFVHKAKGQYDVSDNTLIVKPKKSYNLSFAYYQLLNMKLNNLAVGGGQPLITAGKLKQVKIPVPPLDEQERIAAILNRFDALCNDLTSGIPAEIEARQKQYEYYRDKLLSFKEVTA